MFNGVCKGCNGLSFVNTTYTTAVNSSACHCSSPYYWDNTAGCSCNTSAPNTFIDYAGQCVNCALIGNSSIIDPSNANYCLCATNTLFDTWYTGTCVACPTNGQNALVGGACSLCTSLEDGTTSSNAYGCICP